MRQIQQPPTHLKTDVQSMFDAQVFHTAVDCPIEFGLHTCTSIGNLSGSAPCRDCAGLVSSGKFLVYKRCFPNLTSTPPVLLHELRVDAILLARLSSFIGNRFQGTQSLPCLHRPCEVRERSPRVSVYRYRQNTRIPIGRNDHTALMV